MITNFLLDNSATVPVVLLLVAVVCVVVGYVVVRRRYAVRVLWALAMVSLLPIVALTLVPTGVRMDEVVCAVQLYVPTLGRLEMVANVALFVPPVYFATLATRRPVLIALAGVTLSAVIEAVQALVPAIGRACDTNDWANECRRRGARCAPGGRHDRAHKAYDRIQGRREFGRRFVGNRSGGRPGLNVPTPRRSLAPAIPSSGPAASRVAEPSRQRRAERALDADGPVLDDHRALRGRPHERWR